MQEDLTSAAPYFHHQSMIRTATQQQPELPEPERQLKCPRCDSQNTKFCYFNNYNLTQPRHFCKNCRRYWTRGGSLRNIPVGGGTRKNTSKHSSVVSSSSSSAPSSTTVAVSDQERRATENPGQEMDPTRMLYGLPVGDPTGGSFGSLLASNMEQMGGSNYETGSGWYPGMELGLGSGIPRSDDDAALTDLAMNKVEED